MFQDKPEWIAHQRQRWMRPDAERWLRLDAQRWMTPEERKWLLPERKQAAAQPHVEPVNLAAFERARENLLRLRDDLASLRTDLKFRQFLRSLKAGFREDQLRDDRGRWADEGGAGRTQLAASGRPPVGPAAALVLALELALKVIDAYRSENGLWDLFGRRSGTVASTTVDGEKIFGSNSRSQDYTDEDFRDADGLRKALIEKYPDLIKSNNVGQKPADALFHAEATVLLRAARVNGGTLAGREIEVFADRPMCWSCGR
ncbi:MAG: hypothetical protein AB7S93_15295 [Xanthobacteraceae bacterium]